MIHSSKKWLKDKLKWKTIVSFSSRFKATFDLYSELKQEVKEHCNKKCLYVKARSVYFVSCMENKIAS